MPRNSTSKLYLGDFVLGSVDGTITTFAIIAGIAGADLHNAPGISLILGFANVLADGFSMGASNFLKAKSEVPPDGVGIQALPLFSALVTFVAFVCVGSLPLIPFVIAALTNFDINGAYLFPISAAITACCFIGTGALRARISGTGYLRNILETLTIGGVAATLAYAASNALANVIG
jgi:VIT1/CCC1 family predicted Fe2+/Mn2+ transporter